jgi:hypothetical protein
MLLRSVAASLVLSGLCGNAVHASPGEPFVPAHRTQDGHYVPPNVPPLSAGTHLSKQPRRSTALHRASHRPRSDLVAPMLAQARALPR